MNPASNRYEILAVQPGRVLVQYDDRDYPEEIEWSRPAGRIEALVANSVCIVDNNSLDDSRTRTP